MKLTHSLRIFVHLALLACATSLFAAPLNTVTIDSLTATPSRVFAGQPVTISWSVTGTQSLWLSANNGGDPGSMNGQTSTVVHPTATTNYVLTAFSPETGNVTRAVEVAVDPLPPAPAITLFAAAPAQVTTGQSTTLNWWVQGADSISISADVGASPGVVTGTSVAVSPTGTTNYTLTATNAGGSVTQSIQVVVNTPAPLPVIDSFTATPDSISGGTSTLSWSVAGADSLRILANVGANPGNVTGTSVAVAPTTTTIYTLTATNASGSVTREATVTVTAPVNTVSIDSLTATPNPAAAGEAVTLNWSVTGTQSLWLSANNGGDPGSMNGQTSTVVHPTVTTVYTLTAFSPETGNVVKSVEVLVGAAPAPAPIINSFFASPATVAAGASTTLNWSVSNATSVSIAADVGTSPGAVTGTSLIVSPTANTVYTLTVANASGSVTQTTAVVVTEPAPADPVAVQITPSSIQLSTSASQAFSATVTGSTNQAVTWSVVETGGGSITSTGLFTAPTTAGTFHVKAMAAVDTTAVAQATITVNAPVVTPPANPSSDGTHFVHLMSPNASQRFLAPGLIRVFVAASDINNWPDQNRAASVEIMVDDTVHATIPGGQSEFWVYKTNLSGIAAGPHRIWARAHFVDGTVFDSEAASIVVDEPPAYAQVINLTENVVLTGATNYELVGSPSGRIRINGNGFTISSSDSWTGRLTLKHVDVTNLGVLLDPTPGLKVTTTAAVAIENCVFDSTNSLDVTVNGTATAVIRANEFRSNMYMNVAQFPINLSAGIDTTDPVIRLQGNSTAPHFFQGNNVGLSTIEVRNAHNWLLGGATDADGNVLIGPRVGFVLDNGTGLQLRRNISDQLYYGGWSQGNNFELNSGSDLVVEHNLVSGGSWPVRGTGGTFRYNLVLNAGEDWLWITQSNAQVHHNIFAEGSSDRAGVFLIYGPQGVQFTNNTLDGGGLHQNQIPLLADDGSTAAIASNVFYRFNGTPIVSIKGTAAVSANYNLFSNPDVSSIRNYEDNRAPAQDIGGLNAQVDPQFAAPTPPSYNAVDRGAIWQRTLTLQQILATYRSYYTPAAGSPLTDAGDPAGGAGNDIGAVGSGAANAADQFGLLGGGAPVSVSVSVLPGTKSLLAGATTTFSATVFGSANQSVTWSVAETGGGSITSAGVYTAPTTAGTFHVKAVAAADATASAQATVIVNAAGSSTPTIASFAATPSVIQAGNSTTLSWSVSGADAVSITPDIGVVTGNSVTVTPTATTTYTLTATNTAGSVAQTSTVTVNAASTGPSIDSFTASSTNVEAGAAVTLTWTTTKMGSLWLSADAGGDPGSVAANSSIVVHPQTTTRYAISGWNGETTISKSVTVNVGPPPAPTVNSFAASPATIATGSSTTLNWSVTNADTVSIAADVGASPGTVTGSSVTVSPTATTTYTLTASLGSVSTTRTTTVTVTGPTAPVIGSFFAQPAFIQSGASSTLSWSVSGADTVSISPGIGDVSGVPNVVVNPTETTTYTLSATNEIGTTTRTAVVTIFTSGNAAITHPRIWVTPASLPALVQRAQANDPAWIRLRNHADVYANLPVSFPDQTLPGESISGGYQYNDYLQPSVELSLAYLIAKTIDPDRAARYAAKERELLLALSDPVNHGRPSTDSGYGIRGYVPALALGYDWIFETLSDSDRAQIYTEINRWVDYFDTGGFGRNFPQGNYFAGYYTAKALGALATEGENPNGPAMWNDWLNRIHYGMVQPYHQEWLSGGGAPDGWNYGQLETINMVRPLAAAFTAKGLDLIHDTAHPHAYLDGHAKWITQFTWPDMISVSDRGFVYDNDIPSATNVAWATQFNGLLRFANGDNTAIMQRYTLDLRERQGIGSIEPWADFLFHDANAPVAAYRTDLSYRTVGDGQVAMRSSWDENAVWASFQSGPYTGFDQSAEEHYDEGGLAIQRGSVQFLVNTWGALLRNTPGTNDSGGTLFTELYNELYGTAADGVSSGRRIFNTFYAVREGGGYWGQIGNGPDGANTTTLSRFEEGTDYVLMRGTKLESQYLTGHPITAWTRTVVYLRPQLFVVHDRTSLNSASVDNWMAWHVSAAPAEQAAAAGTHRFDVVDTRAAFGGNLFRGRVTTVLPAGHVVNTVDVFNRGKVFRLEVRPGAAAANNTWLAVFDAAGSAAQAGDVSPLTVAAGNLSAAAAEGSLIRNAAGNYAVLFSKTADVIAGTVTLSVPTDDTYVLVADLPPNAGYSVTAAVANGLLTITVTPGGSVLTTAEGTLKFDVTAAGVVTPL